MTEPFYPPRHPPTRSSAIARILSSSLAHIGHEVLKTRWALHPDLSEKMREKLEKIAGALLSLALGAENEAGVMEYQATLPKEPAPPQPDAVSPVPVCNAESPVGHHCLEHAGHRYDHQDRHGNRWPVSPAPAERCRGCAGDGLVAISEERDISCPRCGGSGAAGGGG